MIYTYKYLPHPIENFHNGLMLFLEKLFALEPESYNENNLTEEEFRKCVNDSERVIKAGLIKIVEIYKGLSPSDKLALKQAFHANSDIESLCKDVTKTPVKYEQLSFLFEKNIKDKKEKEICFLKEFSMKLWKDYPFVNRIKSTYGVVQGHYNQLMRLDENRGKVCPFCGIYPMLPPTESSSEKNRDDYDHIAAESIYPFVSVNFKNLAPACKYCNTNEKKTEDVFFNKSTGNRRVVLYPYDQTYNCNELNITINNVTPYNPTSLKTLFNAVDWDLAIDKAGTIEPYLITWDEVYHIKERYKRCLKTMEKEWFGQLAAFYKDETEDGISYDRFKEKLLRHARRQIQIYPGGMLRYVYYSYLLPLDSLRKFLENDKTI